MISGVDNSLSSHSAIAKITNGSFGLPGKRFSINCTKANIKFCFSLRYYADNSCLFVNGKEIFKFKADKKY